MSNENDFTAVDCGDLNEIPPDLPAGEWEAICAVKKSKTSKDGFPMLVLEWQTSAVADDNEENEAFVGMRASDFVVFFPGTHKAAKMSRARLKAMCEALKLEMPTVKAIKSWADIEDFTNALSGLHGHIYTTVEVRKDTGDKATKIHYQPPGRKLNLSAAADDDDDDAPKKGKKGKK
jgi:hypothetical protein